MTSHSVSAFQIMVKNAALKGDKFAVLDKIQIKGISYDLLNVIDVFLAAHSKQHKAFLVNKSNRLIKVNGKQLDAGGRELSCYIGQGTFGIPSDIIDSKSLTRAHKKKSQESDVVDYYAHLRIPSGSKIGYLILHAIGNMNVKSWLDDNLGLEVNTRLSGCGLFMKPLCSTLALKTYLKDADVRSIRVSSFETALGNDVADMLADDSIEKTLVLKREGGFGSLKSFLGAGKKRQQLVAISDANCTDVKAEVVFNGRTRTISLEGTKTPKAKFYLQEPDVKFNNGVPLRSSISDYATALIDDLVKEN